MARPLPLAELRALFRRHPTFARVFVADFVSQFGDASLFLVFPLVVLERTHDVSLTGLSFSGEILALALLSPLAGVLADRWVPQQVMRAAHGVRLALLFGLAALLEQRPHLVELLVVSLLLGSAAAFFAPARAALVRRLLDGEELETALAIEGTVSFMTRLLAPALTGAMLAHFSATFGLGVNMVCYGLALMVLAPRWPDLPDRSEGVVSADWREGWKTILGTSTLRSMLLLDVVLTLAGMAAFALTMALLQQELHLSPAYNGWLMATTGLAGACGTQLAASLRRRPGAMTGLSLVLAACYLAVPLAGSLPALLVLWGLRGASVGALGVLLNQKLAAHTAPEVMGRVHAAWGVAVYLAAFAGSAASPWLTRTVGASRAYVVLGGGVLLLVASQQLAARWRSNTFALARRALG